jgi:hypothetical protein
MDDLEKDFQRITANKEAQNTDHDNNTLREAAQQAKLAFSIASSLFSSSGLLLRSGKEKPSTVNGSFRDSFNSSSSKKENDQLFYS